MNCFIRNTSLFQKIWQKFYSSTIFFLVQTSKRKSQTLQNWNTVIWQDFILETIKLNSVSRFFTAIYSWTYSMCSASPFPSSSRSFTPSKSRLSIHLIIFDHPLTFKTSTNINSTGVNLFDESSFIPYK